MKHIVILMASAALVLTGCTHPESKKSDAGSGIDSISGADRALVEASEKSSAAEQQRDTLDRPRSRQIASFVPDGYAILATTTGDLDSDGLADKLLVLKNKNEWTISSYADEKPTKRPLLLLLGQTDKSYRFAFRNDDAV